MNEKSTKCIVCGNDNAVLKSNYGDEYKCFDCPICSTYSIFHLELSFDNIKIDEDKKHIISGYIRNLHDIYNETTELSKKTIMNIIDNGDPRIIVPKTIDDKLNMILFYIKRKTSYPSENLKINNLNDYSICFAKSKNEFTYYLDHLKEKGLISLQNENGNLRTYHLTIKGFDYLSKLQDFNIHSNRCFVAMSFKPEYENIYTKAIKPAIEKAKYMPIRIDEENSKKPDMEVNIDDRLIAEIRMSRFMVADFTGQSLNVYYEAGFAYGLGMKVIRCCEINAIKNGALPFDTRNRDHLSWEDGKEELFLDSLYHRIVALLGEGTFKPE